MRLFAPSFRILFLISHLSATPSPGLAGNPGAPPPLAEKHPVEIKLPRSTTLIDDYAWLKNKDIQDPKTRSRAPKELLAYLESENRHSQAWTSRTQKLQEELFAEMKAQRSRIAENSVPTQYGNYEYFRETPSGQEHAVLYRRHARADTPKELVLDLESLAAGSKFIRLNGYAVSENEDLIAYFYDRVGDASSKVEIKNIKTGEVVIVRDGQGWGWSNSDLVWSRDGRFLVIDSYGNTSGKAHIIPLDKATAPPALLTDKRGNHQFTVDHYGDRFYIRSNYPEQSGDKIEFRMMTVSDRDSGFENWREMEPYNDAVALDDFFLFDGFLVKMERADGLQRISVVDLRTGRADLVDLPGDPVYFLEAKSDENPDFNSKIFRFTYQSHIIPKRYYEYRLETKKLVLIKEDDPGPYPPEGMGGWRPRGSFRRRGPQANRVLLRLPAGSIGNKI